MKDKRGEHDNCHHENSGHHYHFLEIELCVKEQKGEQEAKTKENQRLADENFGSSG